MKNVKLLGRTYSSPDGTIWMGLSGTGVEFDFTGSRLSVDLKGNKADKDNAARVGVFVDGNRVNDFTVSESGMAAQIEGKGNAPVNVRIIKLSECLSSCCCITKIDAHGGKVAASAQKTRKIEFIGDSITCGYGVDDNDRSHGFSTLTEDCTKSYSYKTAQLLGADHSLVSFSGYGIVSGYTPIGEKDVSQTLPQYYESFGYTLNSGFGGKNPSRIAWDFSRFTPDVIVIYLGTNDTSYTGADTARQKEYTENYAAFLKQVRSENPKARIICTLGTMGRILCEPMKQAVSKYSAETGDKNISTLELPEQDIISDGAAAQSHPTEATYTKAAKLLSEKIAAEMGWK